jgi:O-antigen ligase
VAGIVIIVGFYFQNPLSFTKKNRLILLCLTPIILLAILKTGSRTSVLVLLLSGLFWYFASILNSQNKLKIMLAGLAGILVLVIPLVLFVSQLNIAETLVARAAETGQSGDFSENGRFVIWSGFLSLIADEPIFGYGLSGYDQVTNSFFGVIYSPHNVLLEILIYGGLIGLLLYLSFLIKIFLASYKMFRIRGEILPVLLLPTVLAFVIALQGLRDKTCWLILAYIVGSFVFSKTQKGQWRKKTINENIDCH